MQTFDKEAIKKSIIDNVKNQFRKTIDEATPQQVYQAVAYAVKDVIIDNWIATQKTFDDLKVKKVYYLSMEFLMGRALGNNIINLGEQKEIREALEELGFDLNAIEDQEPDPALGNGGLGRLAACFLDSLATLGYPAYGCGIRYHYGMFKQKIENGYQIEVPDEWLKNGYPFEIRRAEYATEVKFGGYVKTVWNGQRNVFVQEGYQSVLAVPYDMPIVGYGNNVVNTLRIWDAQPINTFSLTAFDKGDYQKAVEQENLAKNLVEVLYPNDNHYAGKELRLKQQYFFNSASLQVAAQVMEQILEFMKLLMPAYYMAVAFSGGSMSALALYECMLGAVTGVQWLCSTVLISMVRIYVLMVLGSHVAKEALLSKLTELLEQAVVWSLRTLTGLVVGFHLIQAMILPYADAAGQAGMKRLMEMIPGLGQGAGAMAQMVLGSGVLIKNTMGAAAVVVLAVISVVPVMKLTVLMIMYQCVAAVMQPVCDKRVVSCVSGVSKGHKLLLQIVLYSMFLFMIAIAITCATTNVNYFAS